MKQRINEELDYFNESSQRLFKDPSTLELIYSDEAKAQSVQRNLDNKDGYLGYVCIKKDFKLISPGGKGLFYGQTGVENVIPLFLEADLCSTWAPYLKRMTLNKRL